MHIHIREQQPSSRGLLHFKSAIITSLHFWHTAWVKESLLHFDHDVSMHSLVVVAFCKLL